MREPNLAPYASILQMVTFDDFWLQRTSQKLHSFSQLNREVPVQRWMRLEELARF